LDETKSILRDIRSAVGLTEDTVDFDTDLIMHINVALGKLNQNGVGLPVVVTNDTTTWGDFKDPLQVKGNEFFKMVPLFVALSTRIIFDPPPPSAVEYFGNSIEQLLWRLKIAYEELYTTTTTTVE
jgi:hypothetical protein